MLKIYEELAQCTDEWKQVRCGLLTASKMKKIMTPNFKTADNDQARQHVYELAAQRISKFVEDSYISDDMLRGGIDEEYARDIYAEHYAPVEQVGFITNDKFGYVLGYSPDGLVGSDGLIEIKSRRQNYQVQTIFKDEVPLDYMLQIQTGLMVSERKWLDFIQYCGGMPMYVKRVYPDEELQTAIIEASMAFEAKVLGIIGTWKDKTKDLILTERVIEKEIEIG